MAYLLEKYYVKITSMSDMYFLFWEHEITTSIIQKHAAIKETLGLDISLIRIFLRVSPAFVPQEWPWLIKLK